MSKKSKKTAPEAATQAPDPFEEGVASHALALLVIQEALGMNEAAARVWLSEKMADGLNWYGEGGFPVSREVFTERVTRAREQASA